MKTPHPYDENFNNQFRYDEQSPTWLIRKRNNKPAGCFPYEPNGLPQAITVSYRNKRRVASRVIWELFNGPIPDGCVIDHLDGNPHNNNISNLACKSFRENLQNRKLQHNNVTGVSGVKWILVSKRWTYACANFFNQDGKQIQKNFSVKKLGLIPAFYHACMWRKGQIEKLNNNGENYTQRHVGI